MCFAAGCVRKAVLCFLLLSCFPDLTSSYLLDQKFCMDKCEKHYPAWKARNDGEMICYFSSRTKKYGTSTTCHLKCNDEEPAGDQLQCWKNICEGWGFCEKLGTPSIKQNECEEYLNDGKVKYYEENCVDY